ncbi:MAG TPA: formate dehydrogenase accessory protein FdhE [Bryobacteraceae bacterium]|nr:formate dehydrogenase accessory protein FdhE [Bryobacteraceae bacterium]
METYIQITQLQEEIAAGKLKELRQCFSRLRALPLPEPLASFPLNEDLMETEPQTPEARFFLRVLMQPHAERHRRPPSEPYGGTCPSCGQKPVAGVMRGEGDGAKRALVCSMCALEWPYRRLICPNCGEEDKEKLPIYTAAQIDHVRVEACDTCRTYIKSVDLTKDGFAVPQVDEIATVVLNLWADERGYGKVETNILGM